LEAQAIAVMSALNRDASEQMVKAGVTAATDVTGYGLIGHLANLRGGADVEFDSVPFLKGAGNLAERDLFPDGSRRNHAAYRDAVEWGGLGETEQLMLCDAQTSGGLLVAIPAGKARKFRAGTRIGVMRSDGLIRIHR
jgi:selenide,water dikinase